MSLVATLDLADAGARCWDVVVVGAGPAGATAVRELARRGVAVLLLDRATFPRYKVCGCYLNGNALATLQAIGLGELTAACGAEPIRGFLLGACGISARMPLPAGVALSREVFDAALVKAAVSAGSAFLPQTWATLERSSPDVRRLRLTRDRREVSVTARVVLAADGLGSKLLARAGVTEAPPDIGSRMGAGVVLADAPSFFTRGTIFMACGARGYMGLERLEDGRLDMAGAFDADWVREVGGPGEAGTRLLQEVGWPVPTRLAQQNWRGTAALTRRAVRLAGERVFAIGDAAGYVEPFTGEGMAWALAGGAAVAPLAARAAAAWHPSLIRDWTETYRRAVGSRQLLCRAAAAVLRRPWLVRLTIRLLSALPALSAPVVALLNHRSLHPDSTRTIRPQARRSAGMPLS